MGFPLPSHVEMLKWKLPVQCGFGALDSVIMSIEGFDAILGSGACTATLAIGTLSIFVSLAFGKYGIMQFDAMPYFQVRI